MLGRGSHLRAFRVPLHAEHPALAGILHCLHHPVRRPRAGNEARRKPVVRDRLVVPRVQVQLIGPRDARQQRPGSHLYFVPAGLDAAVGTAACAVRLAGIEVLEDAPAGGRVQQLVPPADRQ